MSLEADLKHGRSPHEAAVQQALRDRRERIATAVLSGLARKAGWKEDADLYSDAAARMARIWADALIAELDK